MINTKMTPEERKQLQGLVKPRQENKLINPQEKIGDKIPKNFPIRGEQTKLFQSVPIREQISLVSTVGNSWWKKQLH